MADLSLDALLSANLSGDAQSVLTPSMKSAIGKGLQVAGDLTPAYSFIDTLARGGTPDPMAGVMALGGLASTINPVAGGAIMAAGALIAGATEALHSLFQGLGLIDPEPKPVQYVGLVKKGLAIPQGPSDPLWWPWEQFAKVFFTGTATDFWLPRPDSRIQTGEINVTQTPQGALAAALLHAFAMRDLDIQDAPQHFAIKGNGIQNALAYKPYPKNSFEEFFFGMLKRDLEYWANGLPWVDPRQLLHAAAKAWNDKHQPAAGAAWAYSPNEMTFDIVPLLLSSRGDATGSGRRDSLDTIYGGQVLSSPLIPPRGQTVTTVHVPATNAGPAVSYHVVTHTPSAQNQALTAAFQRYLAKGMTEQQALDAATKELSAKPAVVKVTPAKPLPPKSSSAWKTLLVLGGIGGAILIGREYL